MRLLAEDDRERRVVAVEPPSADDRVRGAASDAGERQADADQPVPDTRTAHDQRQTRDRRAREQDQAWRERSWRTTRLAASWTGRSASGGSSSTARLLIGVPDPHAAAASAIRRTSDRLDEG